MADIDLKNLSNSTATVEKDGDRVVLELRCFADESVDIRIGVTAEQLKRILEAVEYVEKGSAESIRLTW